MAEVQDHPQIQDSKEFVTPIIPGEVAAHVKHSENPEEVLKELGQIGAEVSGHSSLATHEVIQAPADPKEAKKDTVEMPVNSTSRWSNIFNIFQRQKKEYKNAA